MTTATSSTITFDDIYSVAEETFYLAYVKIDGSRISFAPPCPWHDDEPSFTIFTDDDGRCYLNGEEFTGSRHQLLDACWTIRKNLARMATRHYMKVHGA